MDTGELEAAHRSVLELAERVAGTCRMHEDQLSELSGRR
jgi:hypothetical protein